MDTKIPLDWESVVEDINSPGSERLEFKGGSGYDDEHLCISNSCNNGLRIEIRNDYDGDTPDTNGSGNWECFHIHNPDTAKAIAFALIEWCNRNTNPPNRGGKNTRWNEMTSAPKDRLIWLFGHTDCTDYVKTRLAKWVSGTFQEINEWWEEETDCTICNPLYWCEACVPEPPSFISIHE